MQEDWFIDWFDSPYYHLLYSHRDENEAEYFLSRLIEDLQIPKGSVVLDLACGKGRHALFLHKQGLEVTGIDLSENNIREASEATSDKLNFLVGDMRNEIPEKRFDYIFNLFTSFGYFDNDDDNHKVLSSVHNMLRPGGIFILDFLNATKVQEELCADESKKIGGIVFNISRRSCDRYIEKEISFQDKGVPYSFCERVRLLEYPVLEKMLTETGFRIIRTFGSYSLSPFEGNTSDRLIIIAQKQ